MFQTLKFMRAGQGGDNDAQRLGTATGAALMCYLGHLHSLSDGSEYDPDEARKAFRDLRKADWQAMELHQQTLLMRQSLETFLQMERESRDLERTVRTLRSDLEKREEALKRLRELTLGQTGSTP